MPKHKAIVALIDVVIDTNVLAHAALCTEKRFQSCVALLEWIRSGNTLLCVDTGFDFDSSKNTSIIGHEYIERLVVGTFGYELVKYLAISGRLRMKAKRGSTPESRKINQLIRKPRDRAYLGVACNTKERTLVSHDFEDFQLPKRDSIRKELQISIVEASDVDTSAAGGDGETPQTSSDGRSPPQSSSDDQGFDRV